MKEAKDKGWGDDYKDTPLKDKEKGKVIKVPLKLKGDPITISGSNQVTFTLNASKNVFSRGLLLSDEGDSSPYVERV